MKSNTIKKIVWGSWIAFLSLLLLIVTFVYMVSIDSFGWFGPMVDVHTLENPKQEYASELYTEDLATIGKFFHENRTPVRYEDIAPDMIHALVATEDVRFENHSGVDLQGTFAIALYSLRGIKRGSSTLSQQLAKNLFDTRSSQYEGALAKKSDKIKMLINKTKEWMVAIALEKYYTKKEIMTMYLNTVHFGSGAYGVKVASKTFFNTTPDKLKLHEAAMLVGVLKGPSVFNPVFNPDTALSRRNTVLEQMQKYKYIGATRCRSTKAIPLSLQYEVENHNTGLATYFRSQITPYLLHWCEEKGLDLYADGLKIYTTIDLRMQQHAEAAVGEHMKTLQQKFFAYWKNQTPWRDENMKEIPNFIENAAKKSARYKQLKLAYGEEESAILRQMNRKIPMRIFSWNGNRDTLLSPMDSIRYYKKFLQAGFMAMDPLNGHIKAWVGGINHRHFKYDHVKQGKRQPGSTFKPFVYAAAIDIGNYSPCYEIADLPVTFETADGKTWQPENSNDVYSGKYYTLRQAMANSINSIAAHLVKQFGPETIAQYAKRMGVQSPMQAVPSIYLGVFDASVYEMVGAYSTFVNQGLWTEPFYILRIEDRDGNVLQNFIPKKVEALDAESAYLMTYLLRGATEEEGGTALGLSKWGLLGTGGEMGGKTGTTQHHADGWFMGITPHLVAGAWVGGDDRSIHFRTIEEGQGARMAMPIWGLFMSKVFADPKTGLKQEKFPRPEKPLSVEIDCESYRGKNKRATEETVETNW
jgi:penicillin-binding protein 1A